PAVRKQMISIMDKCLLAAQKEKLRFNSDFHKGPETYSVVKRMIIYMGLEKEWPAIHQQLVAGQFKGLPV
ncbi:MAG: hypothetical protein K2X66_16690, partial [Cyanobacteria bacterium]|nr:hypothetical protein [Cyanobacteriota bacterium]